MHGIASNCWREPDILQGRWALPVSYLPQRETLSPALHTRRDNGHPALLHLPEDRRDQEDRAHHGDLEDRLGLPHQWVRVVPSWEKEDHSVPEDPLGHGDRAGREVLSLQFRQWSHRQEVPLCQDLQALQEVLGDQALPRGRAYRVDRVDRVMRALQEGPDGRALPGVREHRAVQQGRSHKGKRARDPEEYQDHPIRVCHFYQEVHQLQALR